jgi:hypothetical protein
MSRSSLSQFPVAIRRAVAEHFPYANRSSFRVKEMVLNSDVESEFWRKPEFALAETTARVLDGCSQPRNQRPHQNFIIL